MQRDDFNVIEVMSEEIDGVIDEIQGKVRCKCLKVLTTLDFNVYIFCNSVYIFCAKLSSMRPGK